MTVVPVPTWSISYSRLVRRLFESWVPIPFWQFSTTVEERGRVLEIEARDGGNQGSLTMMIEAGEMMHFLASVQKQWVDGGKPS